MKKASEFFGQADKKLMFKFVTTYLKAGGDVSRGVLNGEFTSADINKALCRYFDLFVCCPRCSNPETRTITSKRMKRVYVTCASCGYKGRLSKSSQDEPFYKQVLKNCQQDDTAVKQIKRALDNQKKENDTDKSKRGEGAEKPKEALGLGKSPNQMSHAEALESFLRFQERSTDEIIEQVKLLTMSRRLEAPERWAMLCNAVFSCKEHGDVKDIIAKLGQYAPVFRYWTGGDAVKGKAESIVFLGYLCWLACKRVAAVSPVLAAAIATQSVTAEQVLYWNERPVAKAIPNWRGAARYGLWEATPEHMVQVKERCEPFMEYLEKEWPGLITDCPDGQTEVKGAFGVEKEAAVEAS